MEAGDYNAFEQAEINEEKIRQETYTPDMEKIIEDYLRKHNLPF
jgi:hypothetical protein